MDQNLVFAAVGLGGTVLGFLLASARTKHKITELLHLSERQAQEHGKRAVLEFKASAEYTALLETRQREGYRAGAEEALEEYKKSEGYTALMSMEHAKGKAAGVEEERERWQLTYTPIAVEEDGFFNHTVQTGHELQVLYNGFPIGEASRRIASSYKKSKDENIQKFLDIAKGAVEAAVQLSSKIQVRQVVGIPKHEKVKKD